MDAGPPAERWYCVAVEPHAESVVSTRAGRLEITTYYPVGRKYVRIRRKVTVVLEPRQRPALPGYVFIWGDGHFAKFRRDYDAPDAVPHCIGWLSGPSGPEPVPPAAVDDLKRREADGEFDTTSREGRYWAPRWLRPRTRVRIIAGPFKGMCGEIWRVTKARKVAIWLLMMGRPTLTECPIDDVAKAERAVARGPKGKYD